MTAPVVDNPEQGPRSREEADGKTAAMDANSASDAKDARAGRLARALRDQYLEMDRRLLAAFRIYFGLVLLVDILRRFPVLTLFYSNDGVLPNHYAIFAPMAEPTFSVFFACSTPGEVTIAFVFTTLVYVGLIVGYRTRLMQILTLVLYPSLISRNLFFEMGGSCCLSLAAGWTVFLPLGDRFSVDAVRTSLARRRERKASALNDRAALAPDRAPVTTIVMLGLLLQVTAIYFFNCVQKYAIDWKTGEAVHWVLWQNRIATSLCGVLRMHEPRWFSPMLSWGTLVVEASSPLLLLTPRIAWKQARSIFVLAAVSFHAGIALFVDVGPYSYVMFAFDLLVLPAFWFDRAGAWFERRRVARVVVYDPTDAGLHGLARVLARLDTFGKLRFVDRRDEAAMGELAGAPNTPLAARRTDGTWKEGGSAVVEALEATPLGWVASTAPIRALAGLYVRHRAELASGMAWPAGVPETAEGPAAIERPAKVHPPFPRLWFREGLASVFIFITMMQILHDNWWLRGALPDSLRAGPPGVLADVPIYLRQLQGWMMFREPPRTDGTVIVDAETVDGRHIDPFTGKRPDYDVMLHGPLHYGQLFCDYFNHISESGNAHYRRFLGNYLMHWQELEGRPERDRIRSFRVLWVESDSPPYGKTEPTNVRTALVLEGP